MSNQVDPLLFWLEQEPANSDADIYLSADTPLDYALNKYHYQLDKKRHMKRFRAIQRLKAYKFEKIANRRKTPSNDLHIPPRPFAKLEVIKGDDFLNGHVNEIVEILQMAKNNHQASDKYGQIKGFPTSDIRLEERDHSYARLLQIKNNATIEEDEREFSRIRNDICNETRDLSIHQIPTTSSNIQASDSPPLPPRMSSRDPRSFLPEFRKPH